jgi:glycosyltransferase involved in cell wall biosynthesis
VVPRVSVCVPTYNAEAYLGEALESVLAQTTTDLELLICDDASTDSTPQVVGALTDPRIHYERFEQNAGQAGNFNRCIALARGEYWSLLSADDRLAQRFVQSALEALDRHSGCDFFVAATRVVDEAGRSLDVKRPWPVDRLLKRGETAEHLLAGAAINLLCLLVRREASPGVGLFRTDLTWGHDWDWILRLTEQHDGWYSADVLGDYRVHDQSGTEAILRAGSNGRQELSILRGALDRLPVARRSQLAPETLRAFALRQLFLAEHALLAGRRRVTLGNLDYAFHADSWALTRPTFWALLAGCAVPALYKAFKRFRPKG